MVMRQLEINRKNPDESYDHPEPENVWVILDTKKTKATIRKLILSALHDHEMWSGFAFEGCDTGDDEQDNEDLIQRIRDELELDEPGTIGYVSNPTIKISFTKPKSDIPIWKIDGYNYGLVCCPKCGKDLEAKFTDEEWENIPGNRKFYFIKTTHEENGKDSTGFSYKDAIYSYKIITMTKSQYESPPKIHEQDYIEIDGPFETLEHAKMALEARNQQ